MSSKQFVVLLAVSLIFAGCDKNGPGGRPAPNSVPQQQPEINNPTTNQQVPPSNNSHPNTSSNPTSNNPAPRNSSQNTTSNPQAGLTPGNTQPNIPGSRQTPQQTTPQIPSGNGSVSNRTVYYNNGGSISGTKIKNKTYRLDNYDQKNFPPDRKGHKRMTHLSDESYLQCYDSKEAENIFSPTCYDVHAQNCWIKTLTNDMAEMEFTFDKNGKLRFFALINQVPYGADNIGYEFKRETLVIHSFIGAAPLADNQNGAILMTGITVSPDELGGISGYYSDLTDDGAMGFETKPFVLNFGHLREAQFIGSQTPRRVVGGLILSMMPKQHVRVRPTTARAERN